MKLTIRTPPIRLSHSCPCNHGAPASSMLLTFLTASAVPVYSIIRIASDNDRTEIRRARNEQQTIHSKLILPAMPLFVQTLMSKSKSKNSSSKCTLKAHISEPRRSYLACPMLVSIGNDTVLTMLTTHFSAAALGMALQTGANA